ncbi:MAG: NAD(P)-binding domain-containing protein, partial [Pseudomonadota bacterium]
MSSTPTPDVPTLLSRIEGREAVVGIVGLGYVGLPLVIGFANAGFRVIGFDIDAAKIAKLAARESYIAHIPSDALSALSADLFQPTADATDLGDADAILICVPTPLTEHLEPDLSF